MDFKVTTEFVEAYENLDDATAGLVDEAIRRLSEEHQAGWARQGRVASETGGAWILEIRAINADIALYWDYAAENLLLLLLLLVRPA